MDFKRFESVVSMLPQSGLLATNPEVSALSELIIEDMELAASNVRGRGMVLKEKREEINEK